VHYRNSKVYWHLLRKGKKNTLHIICMYIHKWFYFCFFRRAYGGAKERDKKDKYSLKVMKWKLRLMDTWIKVNAFCGLRCSTFLHSIFFSFFIFFDLFWNSNFFIYIYWITQERSKKINNTIVKKKITEAISSINPKKWAHTKLKMRKKCKWGEKEKAEEQEIGKIHVKWKKIIRKTEWH
jgi:hypothetical protein